MKNNLILNSTKICFKTCPFDSVMLIFASVLISVFPAIVLLVYNNLIKNINTLSLACVLAFLYCFVLFARKVIYNYHNHYYLNYKTLLRFEKRIKRLFFDICSDLSYESYLYPEIINQTRRAQNASINIFRLYQIIVEIFASVVGIIAIGTSIVTIDLSLILFLVLTIISPVIDNVYKIIQKKYLLYHNTQLEKEEQEFSKLLTKSDFLKEIIELNAFSFIHNKWLNIQNKIIKEKVVSEKKITLVSFFMSVVRIAATSAAYYSVTKMFINAKINIAEFSMIIMTFSQITQIFNQIFSLFGNLSEFTIMVTPFFDFIKKIKDKNIKDEQECDNTIALNNVSFKYPNSDVWALKDINLIIKEGELVSIVGENGSGKTTLANVLMGFLTPTEGTISNFVFNNGKDTIYDDLSLIPQDFNCYSTSIINNITFGGVIPDYEISDMLKTFEMTELQDKLFDDYGLEFGGIELSGGQKQKIAILRGMHKKCALLICDEPTSAIDPIQEGIINQQLLNISKKNTAIIVSHRLALSKISDKIIVLSDGKIVEIGRHNDLLKKKGVYSKLWKSQSLLYKND